MIQQEKQSSPKTDLNIYTLGKDIFNHIIEYISHVDNLCMVSRKIREWTKSKRPYIMTIPTMPICYRNIGSLNEHFNNGTYTIIERVSKQIINEETWWIQIYHDRSDIFIYHEEFYPIKKPIKTICITIPFNENIIPIDLLKCRYILLSGFNFQNIRELFDHVGKYVQIRDFSYQYSYEIKSSIHIPVDTIPMSFLLSPSISISLPISPPPMIYGKILEYNTGKGINIISYDNLYKNNTIKGKVVDGNFVGWVFNYRVPGDIHNITFYSSLEKKEEKRKGRKRRGWNKKELLSFKYESGKVSLVSYKSKIIRNRHQQYISSSIVRIQQFDEQGLYDGLYSTWYRINLCYYPDLIVTLPPFKEKEENSTELYQTLLSSRKYKNGYCLWSLGQRDYKKTRSILSAL